QTAEPFAQSAAVAATMRKRMLKNRFGPGWPSVLCLAAAMATPLAGAQAPAPPPAKEAITASSAQGVSLDAFQWLRGCWLGSANRREFFEQWSPQRGGMMVGFSHTVVAPKFQGGTVKEKLEAAGKITADPTHDKTQDFEYLRLEQRADGIY